MRRPFAREGFALYAYRLPGGRRAVQSGERAGEGEAMLLMWAWLPPKKAAGEKATGSQPLARAG